MRQGGIALGRKNAWGATIQGATAQGATVQGETVQGAIDLGRNCPGGELTMGGIGGGQLSRGGGEIDLIPKNWCQSHHGRWKKSIPWFIVQ